MITILLQTIINMLQGWIDSFNSHAQHMEDKIDSIDSTASDIKTDADTLPDIKDNTAAIITPIQSIKSNTDSISTSSQTTASNTTAILNNIGTLATNTGSAAAYAEDCANNTLNILDKVTTIASDTTNIRSNVSDLDTESSKIYEAIKWLLADKTIEATDSGPSPLSFDTDIADDLISCEIGIEYSQSGSGTPALDNIRTISGYSSVNVILNGITSPISLGNTYYKGVLNVITGKLMITSALITLKVSDMNNAEAYPGWRNAGIKAIVGSEISGTITNASMNIGTKYSYNTNGSNDIIYLGRGDYGMTQSEWIAAYPDLEVQLITTYAAPIEVSLTPAQLSAIAGVNTISSDTNGDIEVTYKESIKKYLDKLDNQ